MSGVANPTEVVFRQCGRRLVASASAVTPGWLELRIDL